LILIPLKLSKYFNSMFEAAVSKTFRFVCAWYVTLHKFPFTSQLPTVTPHTQHFTQFYESSSRDASQQKPKAPPHLKKKNILLTKLKQNTLEKRRAKPTRFVTFALYMAGALSLSKHYNVTSFQQCSNPEAQLQLETQHIIRYVITDRTGKLTQ